jgi:predicted Holliday junction resolvase-like endonuclease
MISSQNLKKEGNMDFISKFKKIGLQTKAILGFIIFLISLYFFYTIRGKVRAKEHINYELSKVQSEIEIAHLEDDSVEKTTKIEELSKTEEQIREKIKYIKEQEVKGKEVSLEELDKFFDKRGF